MAKKKMKRTYTGSTSVITTRKTSDDSVTVFKDTYTDRETTFRKEQPGVFGILTSMTTYVIIFMLLLFGTSAIHYENNQESLSWIDANGEFKTETYNLTVSYNLDTPLDDLNGNSLNDVFLDNNIADNTEFTITLSQSITNQIKNVSSSSPLFANTNYYVVRYQETALTSNIRNTYYFYDSASGFYWYLPSGSSATNAFLNAGYVSWKFNHHLDITSAFGLWSHTLSPVPYTYSRIALIDMDSLGIGSLTQEEMDYWYTEYQRLQVNMLEDLKTLGAMPLASWNTINEVTRSLIDVYEFGMKLVFPIVDVVNRLISLV